MTDIEERQETHMQSVGSSCITEIILTPEEIQTIKEGFSSIEYDPLGRDIYISSLRIAAYKCMPTRILQILEQQKSHKNLLPYFVIKNLPIDDCVRGSPNFSETGAMFKSGSLSENILTAFGAIIAEPYSIYFEGRELVNNLTAQKDTKRDYTGLGSEVELDLHIENAALKYIAEEDCSPRGLLLLGIRKEMNNAGPKTFVVDSRKAIQSLSQRDHDVLREDNFIIRVPYRWRKAFSGNNENTKLCPLISGPTHLPRLSAVFYPDMVLAVNSTAKKAQENLYEAMNSSSIGIHLLPGTLLYVDNRFALHARESFTPAYDENDCPYRWVQRLFITSSLWNFRHFSSVFCDNGRVFNPRNEQILSENILC